MRKLSLLALVVLLGTMLFSAFGCNTVRGVGKDVQAGGAAIEKAAK